MKYLIFLINLFVTCSLLSINQDRTEHPDTLTVIQRPLLNVPAISLPGENINIECIASQNTQNWSVSLIRGNRTIPMTINNAVYQFSPARWVINVTIPEVPVFEMYDLKVTASGGLEDISMHCVHVIPSRKQNYYFAHITDIHMPTHIYWPDNGYDTDSTETVDFREVINDLNIIRPEFVLITGDLVNQGENEDLENLQWYSKSQRLLRELDIPVYLVAGNHDIGGWDSQPPSDGTARRDWWKFYGWSWLSNPNASFPYHTQDYSFDYGALHFIGLEAYDNYDNWRYEIYGSQSFTDQQMNWLQQDIANHPNQTKVLFHHYDFSDQLDLSDLDVSLALWGHIHADAGSLTEQPYNLATDGTVDGVRAYRIIQVAGSMVIPFATVNAGNNGQKISLNFFPENQAQADSMMAIVTNNQPLAFNNVLIKFNMPPGNRNYLVTNGQLEQIDRLENKNICYVRTELLNYQTKNITIKVNTTDNLDQQTPIIYSKTPYNYPNPFNPETTIHYTITKQSPVKVEIFDVKGQRITTLINQFQNPGPKSVLWNGQNHQGKKVSSGIYFYKISSSMECYSGKMLLMK